MKYNLVAPNTLQGYINLPSSKSISNRALIINAISYSPYTPTNLSDCDDTRVMMEAFDSNSSQFNIGAAGTSMRFLTAFLSKIGGVWIITGSERMKNRPIGILVDALRKLGATIEYLEKEGYPPLKITGRALVGGELEMSGSVSSQFISAILMIAPTMRDGLKLTLTGKIISSTYIRMTLSILREFGIEADWTGNCIEIKHQSYQSVPFSVESDWSAASYWYEMVSLMPEGKIELKGLRKVSYQGDARIAELFETLGVGTEFTEQGVTLFKNGNTCTRFDADLTDQPDLAQTLVVTCALKGVHFRITGLETLKIKETDRIVALQTELKKLGYLIVSSNNNTLEWNGERCQAISNPEIDTYEDHRMAMSFAPVAISLGSITIKEPHVVSKSYPAFWNHLEQTGFLVKACD